MSLYVVSTPIGNLGDITHRALETLGSVEMTYAEDTRRTRRLFDHFGLTGPLRSLHEHNERDRVAEVLDHLSAGSSVALVSDAGTPLVSDPGYNVVRAAIDAGHEVVPIPGASAVTTALVVSGLPSDRYTFLGFVPRKGQARQAVLERVVNAAETTVMYEAPGRVVSLLQDLSEQAPSRPIAVGRELTKLHETVVRGSVREALRYFQERPPKGEVTVVVGPRIEEQTEAPSAEELRRFAREHIEAGKSRSDTVEAVRETYGLRRNAAYRLVHDLTTDDQESGEADA